MKNSKSNIPSVSLESKSIKKGGGPENQYSSKAKLAKVGSGGETRAPQYKLENIKC